MSKLDQLAAIDATAAFQIDALTYEGYIQDQERAATYVLAAITGLRSGANLIMWLTSRCPECGQTVTAHDDEHVVVAGHVVIGCEGYAVINPNAVGIDAPDWQDWREF